MSGNNEDYLRRLKKDGRTDLVDRINDPLDDYSLYAACIEMGYRKRPKAKSRSEQLTYHWRRADAAEKHRFVIDNWQSLAPLIGNIGKRLMADNKDKKNSR